MGSGVLGSRGDAVVAGQHNGHIPETARDVAVDQVKESREGLVSRSRHVLHLLAVGADLMAEVVVARQAHHEQIGLSSALEESRGERGFGEVDRHLIAEGQRERCAITDLGVVTVRGVAVIGVPT